MSDLAAAPSFAGLARLGVGAGVHVRLLHPPLTAVLARKGGDVASRLGIADGPRQSRLGDAVALGIGPGRWLVAGEARAALAGLEDAASLSDHSGGYAVFEVWGPQVRRALAKGVPVDLHPAVFTDRVAVTVIAHIGAIVWQSAPDRFAIAVFRSYAGSFWHWLSSSAAEYGLVPEAP